MREGPVEACERGIKSSSHACRIIVYTVEELVIGSRFLPLYEPV